MGLGQIAFWSVLAFIAGLGFGGWWEARREKKEFREIQERRQDRQKALKSGNKSNFTGLD